MGGGLMIDIMDKGKIIICTFVFAIILCGAVSAAVTVNFSSDGKNITITPSNVQSTLKTSVSSSIKDGAFGYGQYVTLKETGQDNQGVNTYSTINYYNNILETMINRLSSSDGLGIENENIFLGNNQMIMKMNGKDGNITFSGTGILPLYYVHGQQIANNGVSNINFYLNGTLIGKSKITSIFNYKVFDGAYRTVKETDTNNVLYTNGNTRTSVISQVFSRNSQGTETGMVTTGTSKGTENINNTTVSYTGKITISTRHDPKDVINEGYDTGTYKEVRTSSSPVLLKEIPLDVIA
jgi:hypothetical protein